MNKLHLGAFLAIAILIGFVAYTAYALISSTWPIQNFGVSATAGLKLFSSPDGSNQVTEIQWGSVYSGVPTVSQTYYLKNTGNIVQTVTVTAPDLTYGTLTMNPETTVLSVGEQIPVTFTLTITLPENTPFSFGTVLTGTGNP